MNNIQEYNIIFNSLIDKILNIILYKYYFKLKKEQIFKTKKYFVSNWYIGTK